LGFPTSCSYKPSTSFLALLPGRKKTSARGVSHTQPFTLFLFCFILFLLASFYQKYKKISSFIVAFIYLLLVLLEWVLLRTPSCVILLVQKTMILSALLLHHLLLRQKISEIKPTLLNLVMKEQFSGASSDDAAAHLNNFVELCEMQTYKDVDGNIIKLKLFPFSLRGRAKDWLLSLPRNSIDSWDKCKDDFIGKYYPPAKIIALRSDIMKFR
jgi:hypothetical protein